VHGYYAAWEKDGTAAAIHGLLRRRVRQQAGRAPGPTTAILDAQSVKTPGSVPESPQGIDAGKKIKGHTTTAAAGSNVAAPAMTVTMIGTPVCRWWERIVASLPSVDGIPRAPDQRWQAGGSHRPVDPDRVAGRNATIGLLSDRLPPIRSRALG
jgi:hypothetical protein